MLSILLKYINPKNRQENKETCNSIVFKIDQDQKIHLHIDAHNFSSKDADKFALLLFLLNEGYYIQTFLDLITDFAKHNPRQAEFVQQIISSWSNKITENNTYANIETDIQEEPLIKPTQFHSKNS